VDSGPVLTEEFGVFGSPVARIYSRGRGTDEEKKLVSYGVSFYVD
jgi:hypothetical protein